MRFGQMFRDPDLLDYLPPAHHRPAIVASLSCVDSLLSFQV